MSKNMHYQNTVERIWHYIFNPLFRFLADDPLILHRRLRTLIAALIAIACMLLIPALFRNPAKLLNASGLLFDIAGALRLFLLERIHADLEPFRDEAAYPLGPPSVAMLELTMPEATLYASTESPYMSRFYYENRGVIFLVFGFILQMVADLIA